MKELLEILQGIKPEVDFENEKALIEDGVLDSFDIISMVNALNEHYEIEITVAELLPENFNDAEAIWNLVQEMKENG